MSSLQQWSSPDHITTALQGRYRLVRLLSASPTAAVYLAEHARLGKPCALKIIAPHLMDEPAAAERFAHDVAAAAQLIHPNIVQIYDYDRVAGLHYVAMEYIDGSALTAVLASYGTAGAPIERAAAWAEQIGSALEHAHRARVVHRHVNPDNILIDAAGNAHVINFADAKSADRDEPGRNVTRAGTMSIDAPEYFSPEQASGQHTTVAADQYALGAVLYTLLAGRPPFTGPVMSVLQQHVTQAPAPLRELRPDVPSRTEEVILRMLAKDPAARFASTAEAVAALPEAASLLESLLAEARATPGPKQDVRFTVYRPRAVRPERWYKLAVFAHATDAPVDPRHGKSADERVRAEAEQLLGRDAAGYRTVSEDSAIPIARESQLLFLPRIDGFRFSPPHITVDWIDDVERAVFNLMADASLDGSTARGRLSIFNGPVLLAEMALVIRVGEASEQTTIESAPAYRKVFVSYSRQDEPIVRQLEAYARAIGDQYIRDINALHAGEHWDERLLELIEDADVFQLFWSWNSLRSPYVEREWRHALGLGRANFVRPFYWESPFPEDGERPPDDLRALNFQRVELAPVLSPPAPAPAPPLRAPAEPTIVFSEPARPGNAAPPPSQQFPVRVEGPDDHMPEVDYAPLAHSRRIPLIIATIIIAIIAVIVWALVT